VRVSNIGHAPAEGNREDGGGSCEVYHPVPCGLLTQALFHGVRWLKGACRCSLGATIVQHGRPGTDEGRQLDRGSHPVRGRCNVTSRAEVGGRTGSEPNRGGVVWAALGTWSCACRIQVVRSLETRARARIVEGRIFECKQEEHLEALSVGQVHKRMPNGEREGVECAAGVWLGVIRWGFIPEILGPQGSRPRSGRGPRLNAGDAGAGWL
jgi:hypothetical protein